MYPDDLVCYWTVTCRVTRSPHDRVGYSEMFVTPFVPLTPEQRVAMVTCGEHGCYRPQLGCFVFSSVYAPVMDVVGGLYDNTLIDLTLTNYGYRTKEHVVPELAPHF